MKAYLTSPSLHLPVIFICSVVSLLTDILTGFLCHKLVLYTKEIIQKKITEESSEENVHLY